MTLNLTNYNEKTREAVKFFWETRGAAKQKQLHSRMADQGERGSVTAGKNMDGFLSLIIDIVKANGLPGADIHKKKSVLTLPGYFRPTKQWDLLVTYKQELISGIELKSQVGPSFGNNYNNRAEEAIGTAHDFWKAYRDGAFGDQPRPFLGWIIMVEDSPKSRRPVDTPSPHFPIFKEFVGASYLIRYDLLCKKLVKEQLYTTATLVTATQEAVNTGAYSQLSNMASIKSFVTAFAGHIASAASRLG